jgi:hypothetical protein
MRMGEDNRRAKTFRQPAFDEAFFVDAPNGRWFIEQRLESTGGPCNLSNPH